MRLLILFLISPLLLFAQNNNNSSNNFFDYEYVVISETNGQFPKDLRSRLVKALKKSSNLMIVNLEDPLKTHLTIPQELESNPELAAYITISTNKTNWRCFNPIIKVYDFEGNLITESIGPPCGTHGAVVQKTIYQLLTNVKKYIPDPEPVRTSIINDKGIDIVSEKSIREYFDKNGAEDIEGIWETEKFRYKLLFLKDNYRYVATVIEHNENVSYKPGDIKAEIMPALTNTYSVVWFMANKINKHNLYMNLVDNSLLKGVVDNTDFVMHKVYPKKNFDSKQIASKTGEWMGNGSGLIISKSGYIVTNNHVIEDADEIEVEFILNGKLQKFNAEIVQVDKVNDLAIIKIFDMNFDGVDQLPYNFKSRSSDVGTKVYAYGYPMALTAMGKEVKVTDGIISAKSGFDGDITSYQITAAIQKGNSGGPLFDDKGNFIGINSAGIRKDVADNVAYSIKSNYILNLIDVLPNSIDLPSNTKLESLKLIDQVKEISKYVVLIKIK